jgi:site-specific recombinase XerD
MIAELFRQFEGAFSECTLRAYKSDFQRFHGWCEENGVIALNPSAENIASYIDELSIDCLSATECRTLPLPL